MTCQYQTYTHPNSAGPTDLHSAGGILYFIHTGQLWTSDGTDAGTVALTSTLAGPGVPSELTAMGAKLYFSANESYYDRELWMSDGTAAGTVVVKQMNPGLPTVGPGHLMGFGDRLFFVGWDATNNREPWTSDGTDAGTVLAADIWPGACSSNPQQPTASGGGIYFTADDGVLGQELWRIDRPHRSLLRSAEATSIDPLTPPLAVLLPLDPIQDVYLAQFAPGSVDPDANVVGDASRPLVLYGVDAVVELRLVKNFSGKLRIDLR